MALAANGKKAEPEYKRDSTPVFRSAQAMEKFRLQVVLFQRGVDDDHKVETEEK